jgi:hypothetical protein
MEAALYQTASTIKLQLMIAVKQSMKYGNKKFIFISHFAAAVRMRDKLIRQIPLSCSGGAGSIAIEGGALPAGSYYYSLYVDGNLIDTKQMILTTIVR